MPAIYFTSRKKRRLFNSLQNFHGSFFATNLSKRKFCKVEKEVVKKEEKAAAFCRCRHKSRISNQLYISLITFFFFSRKIDSTLDLLYSECTLAQCVYFSLNRQCFMSKFKKEKKKSCKTDFVPHSVEKYYKTRSRRNFFRQIKLQKFVKLTYRNGCFSTLSSFLCIKWMKCNL